MFKSIKFSFQWKLLRGPHVARGPRFEHHWPKTTKWQIACVL